METYIDDSQTSFHIPEIQKVTFHLLHIHILGTDHFGNTRREAFKHLSAKQDMLYFCDYADRVVASFAYKIQSE